MCILCTVYGILCNELLNIPDFLGILCLRFIKEVGNDTLLAMFNENIEKVARFAYTQQFKKIMDDMSFAGIKIDNICILAINAMLMMALFFIAFRKKGLE